MAKKNAEWQTCLEMSVNSSFLFPVNERTSSKVCHSAEKNRRKNMITTAITPPSPEEVLPRWLEELQASDRAKGTIRRYKSAVEGFLVWYSREEQRPLNFSQLSPIALVGYRNYIQRTQQRATSTVNGQISALRAFCAWPTEERYLEANPAKRLKAGWNNDYLLRVLDGVN